MDRAFHGRTGSQVEPLDPAGRRRLRHGALAFGTLRRERDWPEVLKERLSVVAHVFANALERKRSDLALQQAYAEVSQLKERLELDNQYLRQELAADVGDDAIVAQSEAMKTVLREVGRVAATDSTVLLYGETGTGKELLADAVHQGSKRKDRLLVRVNCAALPGPLIESELFGREKGAYTGALSRESGRFEVADGGTLFLDEVGELPLELQAKLLRVLENGTFERLGSSRTVKVNVRLIAASNRDLGQAVRENRFRQDLFFRLQVFPIRIPPLRDRREDIPPLVWAFIKEFGRQLGKVIESVPRQSMEALRDYAWPGNVRELRNVIERSMILTDGPTLRVVLPDGRESPERRAPASTLEDVERRHILDVLGQTGWRISGASGAARILDVKPTTLEYRMKKLGIERTALPVRRCPDLVKSLLDLAVPAITFLLLLGVGLDLAPADFARVRRQPRVLAAGLMGPLLVLPPLALLIVVLFRPSPDLQAGLLLIAACPIGGISNTYSYLARASTALSVTLTACSSLLAVITIPILARAFGAALGDPLVFAVPVPLILAQLLMMLAVPVALGMWVRFSRPGFAARSQPYMRALALGGAAVLILLIVASDPVVFLHGLRDTVPLATIWVTLSFLAGWSMGSAIGASPADRFTLATEFATRNIAVATAIAVTLAGRVEFAVFGTVYFLTEIPLMLGATVVYRRRDAGKDAH